MVYVLFSTYQPPRRPAGPPGQTNKSDKYQRRAVKLGQRYWRYCVGSVGRVHTWIVISKPEMCVFVWAKVCLRGVRKQTAQEPAVVDRFPAAVMVVYKNLSPRPNELPPIPFLSQGTSGRENLPPCLVAQHPACLSHFLPPPSPTVVLREKQGRRIKTKSFFPKSISEFRPNQQHE
jgi:hypothetical protein